MRAGTTSSVMARFSSPKARHASYSPKQRLRTAAQRAQTMGQAGRPVLAQSVTRSTRARTGGPTRGRRTPTQLRAWMRTLRLGLRTDCGSFRLLRTTTLP